MRNLFSQRWFMLGMTVALVALAAVPVLAVGTDLPAVPDMPADGWTVNTGPMISALVNAAKQIFEKVLTAAGGILVVTVPLLVAVAVIGFAWKWISRWFSGRIGIG
jgi:hypothetical protein